jgi:type I restriction enzyme S subunit
MTLVSPLSLGDVTILIEDCLHATAPIVDEGFPLIRTPNIGRGRLDLDTAYRVSQEIYEKWTRRATPKDDDLILAREAIAGNVAIVKNGERVCLGQRTVLLRPNSKKVDPDFLCYFLLAPRQQSALLAGATGVTAAHVNMSDIRKLPLEGLPDLDIQRRLGSVLAAYDDLIENNLRRIKLLEKSARLLYEEWFVRLRFPGYEHTRVVKGVPEGWERRTLGDEIVLNYGKSLKAEERIDGPFPVYGSSGQVGAHEEPLVKGPGIIVGRKGNVGSVFWSQKDFWPIDTVYFIDATQSSFFLYHNLGRQKFISSHGAVPGLNRDFAYSRTFLIPPNALKREFEFQAKILYAQVFTLLEMNDKLRMARDTLLPKLMSGEIEV